MEHTRQQNRGNLAQHNVLTALNVYTNGISDDPIEIEKAWITLQFMISYLPVAMALELPIDENFGGSASSENKLGIMIELHYLKYEGSNLEYIYECLFKMRNKLLQKSNTLLSKIVLLNTFEVKSPYGEAKMHEDAIEAMKALNATHETIAIEARPEVSIDAIIDEITTICQQHGFSAAHVGNGIINLYNDQTDLVNIISLSMYVGKLNDVLILSIKRWLQ